MADLRKFLRHHTYCMAVTRPGCQRCTCGLVAAVAAHGLDINATQLHGRTFMPELWDGKGRDWTAADEQALRELQRGQ